MTEAIDLTKYHKEETNVDQPSEAEIAKLFENLSPDELQQAQGVSVLDIALGGEKRVVPIPAHFNLKSDRTFKAGAWAFTPFGIYMIGTYTDEDEERDLVFFYDQIASYELQIDEYLSSDGEEAADATAPTADPDAAA